MNPSTSKYGRSLSSSSIKDASTDVSQKNPVPGGPVVQPPLQKVGRGNFTRLLLQNAASGTNASLSPQTIQKLINPMRSNLGLPSFSFRPTEATQPPQPLRDIQTVATSNSSEVTVPIVNEPRPPCTSQVVREQSSKNANKGHQNNTNCDFDSKENNNTPSNDSTFGDLSSSVMSALTIKSKLDFRNLGDMNPPPAKAAPTPSKFAHSFVDDSNFGNNNNSISSISEVALRIPSSATKRLPDVKEIATPKSLETTKKPERREGMEDSVRSGVKQKKPSSGSGWKFSSVHVQGGEYLLIKQLGKGGCGEVSLVIEKETKELFALKTVQMAGATEEMVKDCINEVEMLEGLKDSDLVVHIYAWEVNRKENKMKILMEHGQCDLNSSIKNINSSIAKVKYVWQRMLTIVNIIHQRGIVHSDLKPANFIWAGDNLKIIDFGIASRLQQDHTSMLVSNARGTINFMSPENIQGDINGRAKVSPKSDIWSLGCILYFIIYGKTPFDHVKHEQLRLMAICQGNVDFSHPMPSTLEPCSDDFLRIMKSCFIKDYRARPTTQELLQDDFLYR